MRAATIHIYDASDSGPLGTVAAMRTSNAYTLIHFTDVHAIAEGLLHGVADPVGAFRAGLAAVVASGRPVDAIILSGDITDSGDAASYRRVAELLAPVVAELGAVAVVAMGNHDQRPAFWRELAGTEPTGEAYDRVVQVGGLRIVTIDSTVPGKEHGELDDAQLDWLRGVLAEPAPDGSVLVLHHPPIPSALPVMNLVGLRRPERLAEVLGGSDVRLVLAGHTHSATAGSVAGIPVWVGPAGAYALDPLPPAGTVRGVAFHAFTLVEIGESGVTTTQVPIVGPDTAVLYRMDAERAALMAAGEA